MSTSADYRTTFVVAPTTAAVPVVPPADPGVWVLLEYIVTPGSAGFQHVFSWAEQSAASPPVTAFVYSMTTSETLLTDPPPVMAPPAGPAVWTLQTARSLPTVVGPDPALFCSWVWAS